MNKCCICCEDNKLDLGCVTNCEDLVISYTVPVQATYTLVAEFGGEIKEISSIIDMGLPLTFDISDLNESYCFTAFVRDSSGVKIRFEDPATSTIYDCFQFKTVIGLTVNSPSITLNLAP